MTELIVALDLSPTEGFALARRLARELDQRWYKVGMQTLLHEDGVKFVRRLREHNMGVMLDAKMYDTATTVHHAATRAFHDLDVDFLTVFARLELLRAASNARQRPTQRVLAVGITTDAEYGDAASTAPLGHAQGMVCSVPALKDVRARAQRDGRILVCPGIRPSGTSADNHLHFTTPTEAKAEGADYIVVGRPIYRAADPVLATRAILEELAN